LKSEQPELSGPDLQKAMAEEWRTLSAEARAPYVEQARADKERFESEGGKRAPKDPLRPKKPRSAYLFFGEATRAELATANPGIPIDVLSKLIGQEWRKLSSEAREPYDALAEQDQERYKAQMAVYEPSNPADGDGEEEDGEEDEDADEEGSGAGASTDPPPSSSTPGELRAEVKSLRKALKALEAKCAKQEKMIEKLQAKASAAHKRKAENGEKEEDAPKGKQVKAADAEPEVVHDEAHYVAWVKKVLGAHGEKADTEMREVYASKGPKGLAKMLAKKYRAEH